MLVTVHPEHVSPIALRKMNSVMVVGRGPDKLLQEFARPAELTLPTAMPYNLQCGEAFLWFVDENRSTTVSSSRRAMSIIGTVVNMPRDNWSRTGCFIFRGPEGKLDLRAQKIK